MGNQSANRFLQGHTLENVDLVVIAGTPDWGRSNVPIFRGALMRGVPIWFVGIGGESAGHLNQHVIGSQVTQDALAAADVVIARDELAQAYASKYASIDVSLLPCPAMLAGTRHRLLGGEKSGDLYLLSSDKEAIAEATKMMPPDATVACHTTNARAALEDLNISAYTHNDPREMLRFISRFENVVSAKLHGAVGALGCGCKASVLDACSERVHRGFKVASEYGKGLDELTADYMKHMIPAAKKLDEVEESE